MYRYKWIQNTYLFFLASFATTLSTATEKVTLISQKDSLNQPRTDEVRRNWLVISKLTWEIWWILNWALVSLKNFHFNVLLLSKVYIVRAKKVQRSYLSSNWRGIQNLERNQLVVLKLAQRIWQNLTRALESLENVHFNGLL